MGILFRISSSLTLILLSLSINSLASIKVLFHPQDATLEKISGLFESGVKKADLALYNMETHSRNPIIQALQSPALQSRIATGDLKIRIVFEGYGTSAENTKKMQALEDLGADVRNLSSTRSVHHKFGLFSGGGLKPTLVTGSANWTLSSRSNYDENILFIDEEPALHTQFQNEFELLWHNSQEFGTTRDSNPSSPPDLSSEPVGPTVHFNSDHFVFSEGRIQINPHSPGFTLTRQITQAIEKSHSTIDIATTRLKLRPIYDALLRAAARGVRIRVLVSMDEYHRGWASLQIPDCADIYSKTCNSGTSYSLFLDRSDFPGHENVDLRLKFYNLNPRDYLAFQMHNKYLIVDQKRVLTGSFNWSYSSEYENLENLVEFDGLRNGEAVQKFHQNFETLWVLRRGHFETIYNATKNKASPACSFEPMSLELKEISKLLAAARSKKCI
jgi:phosphatidylserine/phosphatidylglycerophosphate/cardiolipin synthase-like enzyme